MQLSNKTPWVILFLLLFAANMSQSDFNISTNTSNAVISLVSEESNSSIIDPDFLIAPNGDIHVVWSDSTPWNSSGTDDDIYHRIYNRTTAKWGPINLVTPLSDDWSSDPKIAVDEYDNIHMVWLDYANLDGANTYGRKVYYKMYNSSTNTWGAPQLISDIAGYGLYENQIHIFNGTTPYIKWRKASGVQDEDILIRSYNHTTSAWNNLNRVTNATLGAYSSSFQIDQNGSIYVFWSDTILDYNSGTDRDIFYSIYDPTLHEWSNITLLSDSSDNYSSAPRTVLDGKNNIHIVWQDESSTFSSDGNRNIVYRKYDTKTKNWGNVSLLSNYSTDTTLTPQIAIDSTDNLVVGWRDTTADLTAQNTTNAYVLRLFNATTATWSDYFSIPPTSTISPTPHFLLSFDDSNNLHFVWCDTTNLLNSGTDEDIFHYSINLNSIEYILPPPTSKSQPTSVTSSTTPSSQSDVSSQSEVVQSSKSTALPETSSSAPNLVSFPSVLIVVVGSIAFSRLKKKNTNTS